MIVGWLPGGLVAVDVGLFTFVTFLDGMVRPACPGLKGQLINNYRIQRSS